MKTRKIMIIVAAVAVIALAATGIAVANWDNITSPNDDYVEPITLPETIDPDDADAIVPILPGDVGAEIPEAIDGYLSITGVIVSIEETEDGITFEIIDEHDNPAYLITTNADTEMVYHWLIRRAVGVGDTVTGWYNANMPMIMIWPPQYNVARLDIQATD